MLNEIIKEFNSFDYLYFLYILTQGKSNTLKKVSIEILLMLLKNLPYEQEFKLKNLILTRTLLIFNILTLYIKPPNDLLRNLSLKFLKSFLISHVEATNLITNLFPMTLFYYIDKDKKPNPINWLDHEWDNFFSIVLKDTYSTQLIWNQNCRNELLDSISILTQRYESFTDDKYLVHALNLDVEYINSGYDREEGISGIKKAESLQFENSISANNKFSSNFTTLNINVSFYYLNYKEIKFEYITLKKHVFVWQYYLKKLISEGLTPNFNQHIDKPKKFWNKLMNELINTFNENKILLIIKTLSLLYKIYSEIIGPFKEYKYFLNIFSSYKNIDIKIMIIQLFCVTIEHEDKEIKEPNLKNLIETQTPEHLLNFISELNSLEHIKNNITHLTYEKTIEYLENNKNLINCIFLDSKENFLKNFSNVSLADKNFPLYTNYFPIDESWNKADISIKSCTLIVRFIKILMKRFTIVNELDFKINFPIPQVKLIFFDSKNFLRILSLLFINNENLILETLDLIINFMNDPLTYKIVLHSTNAMDILVYYMIKYKSKNIMKFIDNMYYYHNVFFSFDFLRKSSDDFNIGNVMSYRKDSLNVSKNAASTSMEKNEINNCCFISDEEYDFFENYQTANKFLCRYFPISLIYHLINSDFLEFINTLQAEEVYTSNLIWNKEMFKKLIMKITELLRNYIFSESPIENNKIHEGEFYVNTVYSEKEEQNHKIISYNVLNYNNSNINNLYSNNPLHSYKEFELSNFAFDPNFKIDYEIVSKRMNCFVYYIDLFIFKKKNNSENCEKEKLERLDYLNIDAGSLSIYKDCDFKIKMKIDGNHYNIVAKSIMQKIRRKLIKITDNCMIIDIEFVIYLKALKFMIKE